MIKRVFSFKGRTARQEWWLFHFGVGIPYSMIISMVGLFAQGEGPRTVLLRIAYLALSFLLFLIYLPIDVRRCHDRDSSGTIAYIVFVLGLLSPFLRDSLIGFTINVCYVLMSWVCLGALHGSDGKNRFGEDPVELRKQQQESSNFLPWFAWILLVCACLCCLVFVLGKTMPN